MELECHFCNIKYILIMYSIQTGIQNSLHGYSIHREYVMHQGYTHNLLICIMPRF